ncbi:MAG: hypothetical protein U0R44_04945 [Candidatus Micrarchaeia archaeon]
MGGPLSIALLLARMKRNQWKGREELRELQGRRLRQLIVHAKRSVPFYRKRFPDIDAVRSVHDLPLLPMTSKEEVAADPGSFISAGAERGVLISNPTSGSSGIQVPVFISREESRYGIALELHQMTECGVGPLDLQVRIAHYSTPQNLLQRLGLFRRTYLPVQEEEGKLLGELERLRPGALYGYPSLLAGIARRNAGALRIRRVFSCGELLTGPAREAIARSFGCTLHDTYGSMETSWIAWECGKGGMHVHQDSVIVEIVDDHGNPVPEGTSGNVIVTPLWQRTMPFIRYRIGDRAALGGRCPCGRGLETIKMIDGRQDDMIRLPSGAIRSARSINIMDDIKGFVSYQIVQERPDFFLFRYVPAAGGLGKEAEAEITRRIRQGCLGEEVAVGFKEVARIERGATGKLRAVVSKVRA